MRPLRTVPLAFPLLLLLLSILLSGQEAAAKRRTKQKEPEAGSDGPPSGAPRSSGELSTKEGHRCTWETEQGGAEQGGAEQGVAELTLQVSCTAPGEGLGQTYECRFVGKPDECPAYGTKTAQYWKQVVGKLKKRTNACEGERVLKTRLCKKAPTQSHLRLAERTGEETSTGRSEGARKESKKKDTKKKETATTTSSVKANEEMKKEEKDMMPELEEKDRAVNDGFSDMQPAENYCGEGWHSVCRFFVKFFDG